MNEELAKTVSLMLKTVFFIAIGLFVYYYVPSNVWIWLKAQAEWGMHLVGLHTSHLGK